MAYVPRFIRRTVLATLCCAVFLMLTAPAALAHDRLKSSSPAKGAKVASIERIKLEFTSRVRFPTVALRKANGTIVKIGKAKAAGAKVTSDVPPTLSAGKYVIAWRVASSDGHTLEGEIPFTLTRPATPSPTPTPQPTPVTQPTPTAALAPPAAASTPTQPISPSPVSATGDQTTPQGLPGWIWAALAALVVIGAGAWLRNARRARPGSAE
ncbi:copper resistance CopC family protein [Streptosporangium subroseum]|uniref:copper resistance CopC family protein n=1 Tax=Streptosporangium subroseum TaxID=106412 RepID=UPI003089F7CC|nr:copper resistance protein CopC [Streptosporangium subroseum]